MYQSFSTHFSQKEEEENQCSQQQHSYAGAMYCMRCNGPCKQPLPLTIGIFLGGNGGVQLHITVAIWNVSNGEWEGRLHDAL